MSNGELAYLVMVISAMVIFAATLAWVSRRPRREERPRREIPGGLPHPAR